MLVLSASAPGTLQAQLPGEVESTERADTPDRIHGWLGAGASIRLTESRVHQQDRLAPYYLELGAAYVFPRGRVRHGAGLSVATNLSADGSFSAGVEPWRQWVLAPTYLLQVPFPAAPVADALFHVRVAFPMSVSPDFSPGVELAVGAAFALTAALGVYAEVAGSMFIGGEDRAGSTTLHPLASIELGLFVDFERLP